jgi:hypothetical protein
MPSAPSVMRQSAESVAWIRRRIERSSGLSRGNEASGPIPAPLRKSYRLEGAASCEPMRGSASLSPRGGRLKLHHAPA